jgi:hypothetical protein
MCQTGHAGPFQSPTQYEHVRITGPEVESAVMSDPNQSFRTRVRVKAGSLTVSSEGGRADAERQTEDVPRAAERPRSLLEALKQAVPEPVVSHPETQAPPATGTPRPAEGGQRRRSTSRSRKTQPHVDPAGARVQQTLPVSPASTPKASWRAKPSPAGRQAAARLKQLERLRETAAGLESLARGEIEEATVEIIRYDGPRPTRRPPSRP